MVKNKTKPIGQFYHKVSSANPASSAIFAISAISVRSASSASPASSASFYYLIFLDTLGYGIPL